MRFYGEERRASGGDVGRKDWGAQEEGGMEESLWLHNCWCFVVSQAKGRNNQRTDGCLEDPPPGVPCSAPCAACSFPVPQILPSSCLFSFLLFFCPSPRELTILCSSWSEFATADFKEWLHISSCHHHFWDPRQRDGIVVAAGCVLPWLKRELIYSLKLGSNICFGWPLEVALPRPYFPDSRIVQ